MSTTIQQAIDTIIAAVPGALAQDTVDTVKIGDPAQPLAGSSRPSWRRSK